MKHIVLLAAALCATPLAAKAPAKNLPGVADQETTIPPGEIRQSVRGHGDVAFVRHRSNQWYRVQFNDGCLNGITQLNTMVFHRGSSAVIDRFMRVGIGGAMRSCTIRSIRRSKAPVTIDSKSPVTLD